MKITGITAEYNPFHNGHAYLIREARRVTCCDAVAVVMSGDFVQRGEPAFTDKHTRACHALKNGADLVIELPVLFCLDYAGRFASAAVKLLETAGCAHIAFGSESGDLTTITCLAESLRKRYAGESAGGRAAETRVGPNDHIASEYLLSMESAKPVAIFRQGAGYHDGFTDSAAAYQSATAIREMIRTGADFSPYVPENIRASLQEIREPDRDTLWALLKGAVLAAEPEMIDDCPSGGEGIGCLFQEKITSARSWEEFLQAVKTKRYSYARLRRLSMQVLLGITRSRYPQRCPAYLSVLAYNDRGRQILENMREKSGGLPVSLDPGRDSARLDGSASSMLALDLHAAEIYHRITRRDPAAEPDQSGSAAHHES